jgi:hypothetical protein
MANTWRDVLPVHPAAELFPMMSDAEVDELAADIRKHGLRQAIVFWQSEADEWSLLDGRNRLEAMERGGIRFAYAMQSPSRGPKLASRCGYGSTLRHVAREADGVDPYAYVLSTNVNRRHLTAEQKRTIAAAVLKAQPAKSDRQVAKQTGVSHPTVAKERVKLEGTGDVEKVSTRTDSTGRSQPATKPPAKPAPKSAAEGASQNMLRQLHSIVVFLEDNGSILTAEWVIEFDKAVKELGLALSAQADRLKAQAKNAPTEKATRTHPLHCDKFAHKHTTGTVGDKCKKPITQRALKGAECPGKLVTEAEVT